MRPIDFPALGRANHASSRGTRGGIRSANGGAPQSFLPTRAPLRADAERGGPASSSAARSGHRTPLRKCAGSAVPWRPAQFWSAALLILGIVGPTTVQAEVKLDLRIEPEVIRLGEGALLSITVEGALQLDHAPQVPEVPGLRIEGRGQSSNFSWINGQITKSIVFQYVVVPSVAGDFTLGPIEFQDGNKLYRTRTIRLTVTAGAASPPGVRGRPSGPDRSGNAPPGSTGGAGEEPEPLFIRTRIDEERVFLGEQVTLRFQFFQRPDIQLLDSPKYTPPPSQGFWREEIPPPQRMRTQTIDGVSYQVTELVYALYPTQTGTLEIGPAELLCLVRDRARRRRDPFSVFDGFFSFSERKVELKSQPLRIQVDPLPQPSPSDFTGGVGDFRLLASVDPMVSAQNEPITLSLMVEGTGNVSAVGEPRLEGLNGFRAYPSTAEVKTQASGDRLGGSKVFKIVLVPETTGRLTIPSIRMSAFDPEGRRYQELKSDPLDVQVGPASALLAGDGPSQVARVGRDLRGIRTHTELEPMGSSQPWRRPGFWSLQAVPLLAVAAAWTWRRRQDRLLADWSGTLRRGAPGRLQRELRSLASQTSLSPAEGFQKLGLAFERYLTDRFSFPLRGRTREELEARFQELGLPAEGRREATTVLDMCDRARFAPLVQSPEDLKTALAHASRAIESLESGEGRTRSRKRLSLTGRRAALLWILLPLGGTALLPSSSLESSMGESSTGESAMARSQIGGSPIGESPSGGLVSESIAAAAFERGNAAYQRGEFRSATREYAEALRGGWESADLWLNLGNSCYRDGRLGWAVYCFERGRRLEPSDPDLRANLEMSLQQTQDRVAEAGSSRFLSFLVSLQDRVPPATSLRLFALSWWLLLLWVGIRFAFRPSGRWASALGGLLAVLFVGAGGWTGAHVLRQAAGPDGVVVAEELPVRSNPDPEATVEFTLHAGTLLRLGRQAPEFREVRFSDKLQGWGSREGLADLSTSGTSVPPAELGGL